MKFDLNSYYNNFNNNVLITNNINQHINNSTIININTICFNSIIKKIKNMPNNIIVIINFELITTYKVLRKLIINLDKINKMYSIKYIINLGKQNFNKLNDELNNLLFNLVHGLITISFNTKKEKYEYIYDIVCDYLDNEFAKNNLCDFKEGKCIANRNGETMHKDNGCCYNVKYVGHLDFKVCGYCTKLSEKGCTIKCISCKFFTCKYYKKQGISFEPKSIFLINTFFNKSQILVLKYNIYRTKEEIINKLLSDKLLPYFLSLATKSYYIKESDEVEKN
ncbi:MAG: hypothetical protein E7311_06995 [Clostridiales bacterium]|nr:hypothetical protein [Clostridiales bacterium]